MAFADSNRFSIRSIPETTWGQTPATGQVRTKRITSSSLAASKETSTSDEIRDDAQVEDISEVGAGTAGDLGFEFAAGSYDDEIAACVRGAWSRPMTYDTFFGSIVSFKASNKIGITGGDFRDYFVVGRRYRTDGFKTVSNNDFFQVSAVAYVGGTNTTEITFSASTGAIEAGNDKARISDANDIVILKNSSIRLGTAGANTIDSNGGNAFAAAIAAGQLAAGQRIFVEGAGFEEGTITFVGSAASSDDVVSLSDGENTHQFQFGGSLPYGVVDVAPGASVTTCATNLATAINELRVSGDLDLSAKSAAGVVTVRNLRLTGGSIAENVDSGSVITVANFSGGDESARGVFKTVSVLDDVITLDRPISTVTGKAITLKACMLRNPGKASDFVYSSFSVEESYSDINQFFLRNGLKAGAFSLEASANSKVTGSVSFTGRETSLPATSSKLNAAPYTVLNAPATRIINSSTNVGELEKNGVPLSTAIQSISLSIDSNLRTQSGLGTKFARGVASNRLGVSGSVVAYFEDGTLFKNFMKHQTVSLSWPFTDEDGNSYHFTIPAVVFTSDGIAPGGADQDVTENIEYMAKRDPITNCMFQMDRFSSINPVASF